MATRLNRLIGAAGALALLALAGCGAGTTDAPRPQALKPAVQSGWLQMPVIQGMHYVSCPEVEPCLTGESSAEGEFKRVHERPVALGVGDLVVFETEAQALDETAVFSATGDERDPVFVNKMTLLYSLDADGDPRNGIQLSQYAHAALYGTTEMDFSVDFETFRQDPVVTTAVALATLGDQELMLAPRNPVQVRESIRLAMFEGRYVGEWELSFDDNPANVRGYTVHADGTVDAPDEPGAFAVVPTSANELAFRRTVLNGRILNGELYADGTGSGVWLDTGGASGRWRAARRKD